MNEFKILHEGIVPQNTAGPVRCAVCQCVFEYPLDQRKRHSDLDGDLDHYTVKCPMPGCTANVVTSYHGINQKGDRSLVPGDAWVDGRGWFYLK